MTQVELANTAGVAALGAALSGIGFAMTDAVAISIVTSASAVVMAGISAYFAYKAKTSAETTGKAVDGHLTEFKAMAKKSFTAEGVLQEKEAEHLRKADATTSVAEGVAKEKADEAARKSEKPTTPEEPL